jgi:hypothetical protein
MKKHLPVVNSVSVFTLFGFIHLKNHPMDGAPVAVGALHLNEPMVWNDNSPKTFLFQTITLEASQEFFLKNK